MREILFRGQRFSGLNETYSTEWVEGFYYQLGSQHYIRKDIHICEVDPKTIGQFTRLTDKNGVNIFEGDILSYDYADCKEFKEWMTAPQYVVRYSEEDNYIIAGFGIKNKLYCHAFRFKHCEVIGNIHETSELLEL